MENHLQVNIRKYGPVDDLSIHEALTQSKEQKTYNSGSDFIVVPKCGRSSVVEHHVANVRVVSSSLIARYLSRLSPFK